MPVGEAFLSAFLQVLFDRLASRELLDLSRLWKIDTELINNLKIILLKIDAVLCDAEEQKIKDMAVKMWLDELQHVAYDAEDILDEFATEGLRWKIEAENSTNNNQVWSFFSDLDPRIIFFTSDIASKIKEITKRLELISKHRLDLGLRENIVRNRPGNIWQRLPTTSLVNESCVYGRDKDKEHIIELLLNDEMNDYKVGIIPIVGMGGIGKTTLAQLVYNDHRVQRHFETKAWVRVSEEFDVLNITKAILESATRYPCPNDFKNLQPLQDSLKEELAGKRFLIVLDDVWNESFNRWDLLQVPFNAGSQGSRVIITTRNEHVASITCTVPSHHLQELSDEYCWLLFAQYAFAGIKHEARQSLGMISRKIVEGCEGLPLAAKTLGGLLRSKLHINEWIYILNSRIYDLPDNKSEILSSLLLSYSHLPAHLKQCFAYCAIFPKGYEFDKEKLVWLWMAEGFIQLPQGKRRMEEVGDEYFLDLLARSFFRQSNGNNTRFVMHSLMNELAQFVAGETCCRLENKKQGGKDHTISNKTRHMSYVCSVYDNLTRFEALYQAEFLRTFLPLDLRYRVECCYISNKVPQDLLPKLRCLRVLCLSPYFIKDLPNSIGDMKHLRYLDFSQTEIMRLPESTSTLHNLQTLILSSCHHLIELPTDMGRLVNLRHIDISRTKLQKMPLNMRRLTSLQTLSNFVVGENCCSGIGELRNISLRGSLFISGLKNVVNVRDAIDANLKNKNHLDELVLEWSIDMNSRENEGVETDVLDMLQPHKNLKMLTIKQYSGSQFSSWIGDPTFSNLVSLCLICCKNCTSLPALGQLSSLEHLTIEGMEGVKAVGPEFYGCSSSFQPFKSLATLRFEDMLQWEEWSALGMEEGNDFPCLHTLFIQRCPKLRGELPKLLPSLEALEIHNCQELVKLPRLPLVRKIVLEECNSLVVSKLAGLSSLSFLSIRKIPVLMYLPESVLQQSTALEAVEITDCDDLTSVSNEAGLQTLVSLRSLLAEERGLLLPLGLKYLKLSNCPNLEKLPSMLHCLTSLEKVSIHNCPRIQSFPIEGFPSMIKSLHITDCHALESLPKGMVQSNLSIELLKIEGCSSLTSFPSGQLPTSVKTLEILDCTKFMSLPQGMVENHPSLESLSISGCHSLTSFPRDGLWSPSASSSSPSSIITTASKLRKLEIFNCENLLSLPEVLHLLGNLKEMSIRSCPHLESISGKVIPHSNLKVLLISECKSLSSLPDRICDLTYLQILAITDCPSLVSFPEGGLPTNLISLCIQDCKNFKQPSKFGLYRLTSLSELIIGGCPGLVSLLSEGLLPTTLTSLHITRLPNLESLDITLQNLNSLHSLTIWECDKLKNLPEEELPVSLSYLTICFCPLLQPCYKDGGKNRDKISHIAYINIDDQVNPSEELPIPELDQIDGSTSFSHRIYSSRKLKLKKIGSTQ